MDMIDVLNNNLRIKLACPVCGFINKLHYDDYYFESRKRCGEYKNVAGKRITRRRIEMYLDEASCKALKINDQINGCANPIKIIKDDEDIFRLSVIGWD